MLRRRLVTVSGAAALLAVSLLLLPFIGKNDRERRAVINTIGPVWDGNEVWMITAGGAMFAASCPSIRIETSPE